jgi:hypothetical protein
MTTPKKRPRMSRFLLLFNRRELLSLAYGA